MNNMDNIGSVMENIEVVKSESQSVEAKITNADLLARMDKIIAQGEKLASVMQTIHDLPVNDSPEGGWDGQARANAIRDIYVHREKTNQKMLDMLNDMIGAKKDPELIDRIIPKDFAGVLPETAKMLLDFVERNS